MTSIEFSNQFDIQYNSIASNSAPSLDLYEKSVYLTRAQLELVKNYFNPLGNKYRTGFEGDPKRRNDLKELIRNYNSYFPEDSGLNGLSKDSQFFKVPSDVFLIIQEQAISLDTALCENADLLLNPKKEEDGYSWEEGQTANEKFKELEGRPILKVEPKTHYEYNTQIDNPFKKPNKKLVWRIDYGYSNINSSLRLIELISNYSIYLYRVRYVKYPKPIILTDLNTLYPGENLSIDGLNTETNSELHKSMHDEILNRAVEMALVDYKPDQALQMKVQLNQRDE